MTEPRGSDERSRNGVATGAALGPVFGAAAGLVLFDSLLLGAGLGLLLGVTCGAAFDVRTKNTEPE